MAVCAFFDCAASHAQNVLMYWQDLPTNARTAPQHLNNTGCCIKYVEGKGRGVFGGPLCLTLYVDLIIERIASRALSRNHLLEISPVLLFTADEYELHGRHTVLDHYTFVWRDGRMALALGIGRPIDFFIDVSF